MYQKLKVINFEYGIYLYYLILLENLLILYSIWIQIIKLKSGYLDITSQNIHLNTLQRFTTYIICFKNEYYQIFNMSTSHRGRSRSSHTHTHLSTFRINIVNVKMKVKFPCKMRIQLDSISITNDVPVVNGSFFQFNQQCALIQKNSQKYFTLSINLITSKGAKYIAGLALLYQQQLIRAASAKSDKRVVIGLSKCLDNEAVMEVIVKDSVNCRQKQQPSRDINQSIYQRKRTTTINASSILDKKRQRFEPITPRNGTSNNNSQIHPTFIGARNEVHPASFYETSKQRRRNPSTVGEKHLFKSNVSLNEKSFGLSVVDRDKAMIEMIRGDKSSDRASMHQSYSKLKQKLRKQELQAKKQHEKRLEIENSQTMYKVQAIKYKLKCQQFEANLNQKNSSISKMQSRIDQLEKLLKQGSIDLNLSTFMKSPSGRNLLKSSHQSQQSQRIKTVEQEDENIIELENKIKLTQRQLQDLRNKLYRVNKQSSQKQELLTKELERKNLKIEKLEEDMKKMSGSQNPTELLNLKLRFQAKDRQVKSIQKEAEQNLRKYSELSKENKGLAEVLEQHKKRIQELCRTLNSTEAEKKATVDILEQEKNKINLCNFEISTLKQTIVRLQSQLDSLHKMKQKYHQALVEIKKVEGERKLEQRNFEGTAKMMQNNIVNMGAKYKQQVEGLKRKNQQLQAASFQNLLRIKQLETYANTTAKNEIQNYRRLSEKLQRDCEDLRNSERNTKREMSQLESKIIQITNESESWKNKYKSLESIHKFELQKISNENNKLKANLQQQLINQFSLKQKNQNLLTEVAVSSNKLIMLEERYNRETKELITKVESECRKSNKLADQLKKYEQSNIEIKSKEKQLIEKLTELGQNQSQYSELIKRYEEQMTRIKGILRSTQQKLQKKHKQNEEQSRNLSQISEKYKKAVHQQQEQAYAIRNLNSEVEKDNKEKQKLQLQLSNLRQINENKDKTIEKQKNTIQHQMKSKIQLKQQILKISNNHESMIKQYDHFRNYVYDVLLREFTGVDGLDSISNFTLKRRDKHFTLKQTLNRNSPDYQRQEFNKSNHRVHTDKKQELKLTKSSNSLDYPVSAVSQFYAGQTNTQNQLTNNDIISTINYFSRQSKSLLSKMIQEYKIVQEQLQYSKSVYAQKEMKFIEQSQRYQKSIHALEEQISKIIHQKQNLKNKYQRYNQELQQNNYGLKDQVEKMKQKFEQVLFTCNGLKLQKENEKQFFDLRIQQTNNNFRLLQQAHEDLAAKYQRLDQVFKRNKIELEEFSQEKKKLKDELETRCRKSRQLESDLSMNIRLYEESNSKNKQLLVQISQLELTLNNEREKNGKNQELINLEQKKLNDSKDFINSLIKQKQAVVKQEIANTQRIIELQSVKISLENENQRLKQQLTGKSVQLSMQKQMSKKNIVNIKEYETQIILTKQDNKKLTEKLKQKQKELTLMTADWKSKENGYLKQIQNRMKQLQEFRGNRQLMQKLFSQQKANLVNQIKDLQENMVKKLQQQLKGLKRDQQGRVRQLQSLNQVLEEKSYEVNGLRQTQSRMKRVIEEQERTIQRLSDESKDKQEQIYNITSQYYILQQKYQQSTKNFHHQKQQLDQDFQFKYDSICQDYETKIDEMERERDYMKEKIVVLEQENQGLLQKIKQVEEQQQKSKFTVKQKLIKSEQERNLLINSLRTELKKCTDARNKLEEEKKKKQIQLQKLKSGSLVDKNLIQKLQMKLKENQSKLEQIQTQLSIQSQNDRKKQILIKNYEESIGNYQWVLERQIKKELQGMTKSIMSIGTDNADLKKRLTQSLKETQSRLSKAVGEKIPTFERNRFSS